jgi:transcriptional regulator with XRE-family HTH domain
MTETPTETPTLWVQWGRAVRQRRKDREWSQHKLAVEAGLVVTTISDIERGVSGGSDQTKIKVAHALGVEVHDLFSYPPLAEAAAS